MNLYHVSRNSPGGYETYSDFVCVSANPEQARAMHPNENHTELVHRTAEDLKKDDYAWRYGDWTFQEDLTVDYLGKAAKGEIEPRVVCASFHAG